MIRRYRLYSQKIVGSDMSEPEQVVSWMGAVQAQEANMSKWALGMRLFKASIKKVDTAIDEGKIIRLHILRPTWHYVAAEDLRWMCRLSSKRLKTSFESYSKGAGITIKDYVHGISAIARILEEHGDLTRVGLVEVLSRENIPADDRAVGCYLAYGEADSIFCSGRQKDGKHTYALTDKRVPFCPEKTLDESLAMLAIKYFRSHCPATLNDFVWWSGLSITECKKAIWLAGEKIITDKFNKTEHYLHTEASCGRHDSRLRLLPSYDEYLISYKDRTAAIDKEKYHYAFNNYGIFHPVLLHKGRIVGNWRKRIKSKGVSLDVSFFDGQSAPNEDKIRKAEKDYQDFLSR